MALAGFDGADEVPEMAPGVLEVALLGASYPVLDLGEGPLDGIEVG